MYFVLNSQLFLNSIIFTSTQYLSESKWSSIYQCQVLGNISVRITYLCTYLTVEKQIQHKTLGGYITKRRRNKDCIREGAEGAWTPWYTSAWRVRLPLNKILDKGLVQSQSHPYNYRSQGFQCHFNLGFQAFTKIHA